MELGYFTMPSHPPERPLKDGHEWDLKVIRWLDELGYKECWIGEHHTAPWEPQRWLRFIEQNLCVVKWNSCPGW